jgi:hypothetical protein
LYATFDRRGFAAEYWGGQLIQTFNDFDPVVGSTVSQEASLQLDKMRAMGVTTITYELRTADATNIPGPSTPPVCNANRSGGLLWPQPTTTELTNLVAFFDLVQSKGMRIFLRLVNVHMEEQPPANSQTWLGSILRAVKDHPALDLVLFEGDERVHLDAQPNYCGKSAEPPLWLGPTAYAAQYIKWAITFARSLGLSTRKLSAEAIVGGYFIDSQPPAGSHATDGHFWAPIVSLKRIFDDLAIPDNQRTYAISFFSHRKCSDPELPPGLACSDEDPHTWADETLQRVFATIGTGNGARVVAPEMGLSNSPTASWTTERAVESLFALMEKYGVDGGSFWKWVAKDMQEDSDKTQADAVKRRGVDFIYNPVQKEILDIGGFHLTAIPNGSFETGNAIPDNWSINGNGTGARYFLAGEPGQPEVPSRGQYALRLATGSGTNDTVSATSDFIGVSSNTTYTTTANLRFLWTGDPNVAGDPNTRPQVFVLIRYFDKSGQPSGVRAQDVFRYYQENGTNGFATFPLQYTTPGDAVFVRIEVGAARNGLSSAITFDVDNIR